MGAHDDSSIERNRQPTVLDNSVLASGLVSAGLPRGARPRVFTPSAINTIRGLAGQGKSASEIAEVIGSTTRSVQVKCSQLKIKLRRHAGLPRGARPRVFTPSSITTSRWLAGQGKSASEIAEVIGSTTGSVRVRCSQLKIKLRQGQRGARRRVFTPSAINRSRGLAGQGKSASEIAEVVGSTTRSVRVKCSQLKIKLRQEPCGREFTPNATG